jgi:hypothetical protein
MGTMEDTGLQTKDISCKIMKQMGTTEDTGLRARDISCEFKADGHHGRHRIAGKGYFMQI